MKTLAVVGRATGKTLITLAGGPRGVRGEAGESAYQAAVREGFEGTEEEYAALPLDAAAQAEAAAVAANDAVAVAVSAAGNADTKAGLANTAAGAANAAAAVAVAAAMMGGVYAETYGVVPANPSPLASLNIALDAANAAGKTLILPPGVINIPDASPVLNIVDGTRIIGAGRGLTTLLFTGLDTGLGTATDVINVVGKRDVLIADLALEASTLRTGGNNAFQFLDCVDCTVYRCAQTNFTQGFVFARSTGAVPPTTTNLRNKAIECVSLVSHSYGFFQDFATACEFLFCEAYGSTGYDGFKTGGGTTFAKIIGCHSEGNAADGFDTYDGFISSVLSGCTAYGNGHAGYQIKGTVGGTYDGTSFVGRESLIAHCVAQGNALNGFLFQSVRQLSVSSCLAVENLNAGFVFNEAQQCTSAGLLAIRNAEHGFSLIGSTSRCTFAACTAADNSYVDGTTQNDTYDGWSLNTANNNTFVGCRSGNGTEPGRLGGQRYGFDTGSTAGNNFSGCRANANVSGDITGTTPFTSNAFDGFYGNGGFYGVQVSADGVTPGVYRSGNNAQFNLTRAGGAEIYFQAQASLGAIGTTSAHPLHLATGGTRRWELSTSGHFSPIGNNVYDVGASTNAVRSVYAGTGYRVGGVKVVGGQGAAVPDATDAASAITQLNALLARCRAHGLIAP